MWVYITFGLRQVLQLFQGNPQNSSDTVYFSGMCFVGASVKPADSNSFKSRINGGMRRATSSQIMPVLELEASKQLPRRRQNDDNCF